MNDNTLGVKPTEQVALYMVNGQEYLGTIGDRKVSELLNGEAYTFTMVFKKVLVQSPQGPASMLMFEDVMGRGIEVRVASINAMVVLDKDVPEQKALLDQYGAQLNQLNGGIIKPVKSLLKL